MNGVSGRHVLLTGVAGGIGRAIAAHLAEAGARVTACDNDIAGLDAARAELDGARSSGRVDCVALDVRDEDAIGALVARSEPFDALVHSAGGVAGQTGAPIETITRAAWDAVADINLTASFLLARALVPAMRERRRGAMLMISSGAGIERSLTGIQSYASSKAGQLGLVRQLAHELGPHGIRVNAVAPGFVRSNRSSERQWQLLGEAGQQALVDGIALKRLGTPDDVASAALFLLSDAAAWVTGQVLRVDGGR